MSRTSVGAITLVDIKDGFDPITVILGNQNHSFAASSSGAVDGAVREGFECQMFVYLGVDRLNVTQLSTQPNETYKIIGVTSSNGGWIPTVNYSAISGQAVIELSSIPAGITDAAKSTELTVELDIKNALGNVTTVETIITLNKAVQGAGGTIVTLVPSRQTFQFDENNSTSDSDIVISVDTEGTTGSLSATKSINGGSFSPLSQGNGADQAKLVDLDGNGLVISSANFSDSNVMSIKVSGSTGGVDVVSIAKIQDGNTGPASLTVIIESSVGGQIFKNNTGPNKTLTAKVYDNANGSLISSGITYTWLKDGNAFAGNVSNISVGPGEVDDGGSNEFTCIVSVN